MMHGSLSLIEASAISPRSVHFHDSSRLARSGIEDACDHSSRLARSGIEEAREIALELRLDNVAAQNSGCKVPGLAHLSHAHDVGILRFIWLGAALGWIAGSLALIPPVCQIVKLWNQRHFGLDAIPANTYEQRVQPLMVYLLSLHELVSQLQTHQRATQDLAAWSHHMESNEWHHVPHFVPLAIQVTLA
jgi:hypothetical protein